MLPRTLDQLSLWQSFPMQPYVSSPHTSHVRSLCLQPSFSAHILNSLYFPSCFWSWNVYRTPLVSLDFSIRYRPRELFWNAPYLSLCRHQGDTFSLASKKTFWVPLRWLWVGSPKGRSDLKMHSRRVSREWPAIIRIITHLVSIALSLNVWHGFSKRALIGNCIGVVVIVLRDL